MVKILNIAGRFVVYRPHMSGRPVYVAFDCLDCAAAYRRHVA
jgi:hypothetical protein